MFTQEEKDFLVSTWKKVMPGGQTREQMEKNLAVINVIQRKLEELPVEEPVDVEPAVSPELVRAVEGKTRKRH